MVLLLDIQESQIWFSLPIGAIQFRVTVTVTVIGESLLCGKQKTATYQQVGPEYTSFLGAINLILIYIYLYNKKTIHVTGYGDFTANIFSEVSLILFLLNQLVIVQSLVPDQFGPMNYGTVNCD